MAVWLVGRIWAPRFSAWFWRVETVGFKGEKVVEGNMPVEKVCELRGG